MQKITVYAFQLPRCINALLAASENYMLEHKEVTEIVSEVRAAIKDWRALATLLQISPKLLEPYTQQWDNC